MFHFNLQTRKIGIKLYSDIYLYNKRVDSILGYRCLIDSGADNLHILTDENFISQLDFVELRSMGFHPSKKILATIGGLEGCFIQSYTGSSVGVQKSYTGFLRSIQIGGILIKNMECSFYLTNQKNAIKDIFLFPLGVLFTSGLLTISNDNNEKSSYSINTKLPGNYAEYIYSEEFHGLIFDTITRSNIGNYMLAGDKKMISHCYQNMDTSM